ncbi:MAG: DMT family transporter [Eubacteriales bacterium]|nr:DMT family transporter [Eubacteriales bacterium]
MKTKKIRNTLLLFLTAFIWGAAFVAQSSGGDAVGPYTFNCSRSIIGSLVLIPVIFLLDGLKLTNRKPVTKEEKKTLWIGGLSCGLVLCIATNLQQVGINSGTPAGKAGFLTACYIILVPILGLFLKKKSTWNIWLGVMLTVIGLYLLCMKGSLSLQFSDILLLLCALDFSVHILIIDYFSPKVDGVRMSCIQFMTVGILTAFPMFFTEMNGSFANLGPWLSMFQRWDALIPILYAGVFSSGVAYTLQIIGQQDVNPTVASLILSLESVFSVLAGAVILGEMMSLRELCGCAFIFAAVILAQIPVGKKA